MEEQAVVLAALAAMVEEWEAVEQPAVRAAVEEDSAALVACSGRR